MAYRNMKQPDNAATASLDALSAGEEEMARHLLRQIAGMDTHSKQRAKQGGGLRVRLRRLLMRLRLNYEIFRLGHDADSIWLYRHSMAANLPLRPLPLRVWARLLRDLR